MASMGGSGFYHGRVIRLKRILSSSLFRFSLGFLVSGLSLYLALHEVNLTDLRQAFSSSDCRFLVLALISVAVNILLKVLRWGVLLGNSGKEVGLFRISLSFLTAQMLNTFLPARAGEISRVYVLGRYGIGQAFVLGTIALEMMMNLFAYTMLFLLLLILIPMPEWIDASGLLLVISVLFIFIMLLAVTLYRERLSKVLSRIAAFLPLRIQSFLIHHLDIGLTSLEVLKDRSQTTKLIVTTALIWGTAILTNQLVLLSLNVKLPLTAPLLVLIALQAGISIPSLPGKLGIFEYICILVLEVFGIGQASALSYGILLHIVVYLPLIIFGFPAYWILGSNHPKSKTAPVRQ
jgi:uncharacterized protein (TIRG00374 family)